MPKAILEYDLSDPSDVFELKRVTNIDNIAGALFEISVNLRRRWKHAEKEPTSEEVFEAINEILNDYNIDEDELVR